MTIVDPDEQPHATGMRAEQEIADIAADLKVMSKPSADAPADPVLQAMANRLEALLAGETMTIVNLQPVLDGEEQVVMDQLLVVMRKITQSPEKGGWGMTQNNCELTAAVHVIQGFIVQHMLHRLVPGVWSGWDE